MTLLVVIGDADQRRLAAEAVTGAQATDLVRLDLGARDLGQVDSPYLGETEKNLSAAFDAAERGGSVLLLDEADALFGKRSDVADSHDRYADIEVSALLDRAHRHTGPVLVGLSSLDGVDPQLLARLGATPDPQPTPARDPAYAPDLEPVRRRWDWRRWPWA